MDEDIEKGVDGEEQPAGKFPLKWIIIGVVVLVLAGGGYVGWTMLNPQPDQTGAEGGKPSDAEAVKEVEVGAMFEMDPFVVNLDEAGGKRYLKSKIEIEFVGEDVRKELTNRLPQLRDTILLHLSSKTLDEIRSVDGKIELKDALIKRINQVLKQGKIRNLYFTQFVIQ
ncbi:MAG TPA: flagellar basal body protein FliL [Deltaproteobacteria bacterium]|nr:flagellar basal body protein FliL [Deltaproteobacteria bacterium]